MKGILLLIFFVLISGVTLSQSLPSPQTNGGEELIVLTKSKHDALRKDIDDYKVLLIKYNSMRLEYEVIFHDLDRQSKLTEKTFGDYKKSVLKIEDLEDANQALRLKLDAINVKYADLSKKYQNLSAMYHNDKYKIIKLKMGLAELWIWRSVSFFSFFSIFVVAANQS